MPTVAIGVPGEILLMIIFRKIELGCFDDFAGDISITGRL
jgi:hypothetical protein